MRTGSLFRARERFLRQVGHHGMGQFLMDVHRPSNARELVGVYESAGKLVIGICRQAVVREKLSLQIERLSISLDQAVHFGACRLPSRSGIGSGES